MNLSIALPLRTSEEAVIRTIRILIVDNHQIVVWGLQRLIDCHKPGIEVVSTAGGIDEARAKVKQFRPDLVMLAWDLETENPLETIRQLKTMASNLRILIIAAGQNETTLDKAILLGARGIVRKDDPPEWIVQAIEKVMSGQFWLDRATTSRLFDALVKKNTHVAGQETRFDTLTGKEKKVVEAVMENSTAPNKSLAKRLFMSEHTLRHHLTSIYRKLGVSNRFALYLAISRNDQHPFPGQNDRAEMGGLSDRS